MIDDKKTLGSTIGNEFQLSVERFNEYAEEFAERFMDVSAYHRHFDKFCNGIGSKSPEILELACGPGNVTRYLLQRFPQAKITAIDLAPAMIEIASRNIPGVTFKVMDVRDISVFNKNFDAIMCSFCLPFLSKSDTRKLIADCFMLLSQNGVLYISTMEGDESRSGFETTSFSGDTQLYFNYYMQEELLETLQNAGFKIEYYKRQVYLEPNGGETIDLLTVVTKN